MTRSKLALSIIAAGAGLSIWMLASGKQTIPTTPRSLAAEIGAVIANKSAVDSDGDGLLDWEENALGTNPQKPDTDADGYLDGEEVTGGYSPLRPAPDDAERGEALYPRISIKNLSQAATQRIARTVTESVAEALSKKGPAGLQNPRDIAKLAGGPFPKELARELEQFLNPAIDSSRFAIDSKTTREKRHAYLRSVMHITLGLNAKAPDQNESEVEVMNEALTTLDFAGVLLYRNLYQQAEERIQKLSVPVDLVPLHQEILGILHIMGAIHQSVSEVETDPLKSTLALQALPNTRARFERFAELLAKAVQ